MTVGRHFPGPGPVPAFLPLPYPATGVNAPGKWLADADLMVYSTSDSIACRTYSVESLAVNPSRAQLAAAPKLTQTPGPAPDLELPASYETTALRNLAETYSGGQITELGKVNALANWLSGPPFSYSHAPVPFHDAAGLLSFLTKTRSGFCVQYAWAMTVLTRLIGIPARMVAGYTAGTRQANGRYVVTSSDAHAWTEVYFPTLGWIRFEPTPGGGGTANQPNYMAASTDPPTPDAPANPVTGEPGRPDSPAARVLRGGAAAARRSGPPEQVGQLGDRLVRLARRARRDVVGGAGRDPGYRRLAYRPGRSPDRAAASTLVTGHRRRQPGPRGLARVPRRPCRLRRRYQARRNAPEAGQPGHRRSARTRRRRDPQARAGRGTRLLLRPAVRTTAARAAAVQTTPVRPAAARTTAARTAAVRTTASAPRQRRRPPRRGRPRASRGPLACAPLSRLRDDGPDRRRRPPPVPRSRAHAPPQGSSSSRLSSACRRIPSPARAPAPPSCRSMTRPSAGSVLRTFCLSGSMSCSRYPWYWTCGCCVAEEPVQGDGGGPGLVAAAERGAGHGVVVLRERAVAELVEGGRPEPRCDGSLAVAAQRPAQQPGEKRPGRPPPVAVGVELGRVRGGARRAVPSAVRGGRPTAGRSAVDEPLPHAAGNPPAISGANPAMVWVRSHDPVRRSTSAARPVGLVDVAENGRPGLRGESRSSAASSGRRNTPASLASRSLAAAKIAVNSTSPTAKLPHSRSRRVVPGLPGLHASHRYRS